MKYHIEIFRKFNLELKGLWTEFQEDAEYYGFQCYEWNSHWYWTVGKPLYGVEPAVVVISSSQRVIAIFPLCLRKTIGNWVLEWLGGNQTDYHGPLISTKYPIPISEFSTLWADITQSLPSYDVMHLMKQPEKIGSHDNPLLQLKGNRPVSTLFFATLPTNWDNYLQSAKKRKIMNDSRRQRNRLSKKGQLTFVIATESHSRARLVKAMIQQKRQRYREIGTRDHLGHEENRNFYENIPAKLSSDGEIQISALLLDNKVLSCHWGMIHRDRFYYLMPSFESGEWSKYSPGRLLLENLIEWSISKDLKIFDFTVGDERYKQYWCDTEMELFSLIIAKSLKGSVYVIFHATKNRLSQLTKAVLGLRR